MNIGSGKGFPLSQLGSHALHSFVLDGVTCTSLESFIQGLKFEKPSMQASICREPPKVAKERGKKALDWKNSQTLWWCGVAMERESAAHRLLLERVVKAAAEQSELLKKALLETGTMALVSMTQSRSFDASVTEAEYCQALTTVRSQLAS